MVVTLNEAIEYYTPRIDAGIAWLKSVRKGRWEKGIDLNNLKMSHGCNCICGQAFVKEAAKACQIDGFDWAARRLTGGHYYGGYGGTAEYGFFRGPFHEVKMSNGTIENSWTVLGDLWAERIKTERRRIKKNLIRG